MRGIRLHPSVPASASFGPTTPCGTTQPSQPLGCAVRGRTAWRVAQYSPKSPDVAHCHGAGTRQTRRTTCAPRSSAAALPAAVRMSPSSTNSTSDSSRTERKRARKESAHCRCAVARRPSRTPASESVKAPLQKPTRRAPRACARRTASSTAGRRGTSMPALRWATVGRKAPTKARIPRRARKDGHTRVRQSRNQCRLDSESVRVHCAADVRPARSGAAGKRGSASRWPGAGRSSSAEGGPGGCSVVFGSQFLDAAGRPEPSSRHDREAEAGDPLRRHRPGPGWHRGRARNATRTLALGGAAEPGALHVRSDRCRSRAVRGRTVGRRRWGLPHPPEVGTSPSSPGCRAQRRMAWRCRPRRAAQSPGGRPTVSESAVPFRAGRGRWRAKQ